MASACKGDSQDLRIVLLGVSGAGKSSIGNAILGREAFKVSETTESEIQGGRVEDRNISIIDTPGFFNTQLTDEEMKKQMMKSLDLSDPGPHVFLLVINLENFDQDKRNILEEIQENFGAQALKFTMPLFTGGEKMLKREWATFKFSGKYRDLVKYCMNNSHVFNNKTVTDPNNITNLLDKIDKIKPNDDQHYNKIYFKYQIKSRQENKKQEEENDREKEQAKHKKKLIQEINKMPKLVTTNFLKHHETKKNVRMQDRVLQENKKREEEERQDLEEEKKIREGEKMRLLKNVKGVALVGTGVAVCAGAAVAVGAVSPALITVTAVAGGGAILASVVSGATLYEALIAGAVAAGNTALSYVNPP